MPYWIKWSFSKRICKSISLPMFTMSRSAHVLLVCFSISLLLGCSSQGGFPGKSGSESTAGEKSSTGRTGAKAEETPIVELAIARRTNLSAIVTYSGTTAPQQTITLRSRSAGQLMDLKVDVGDRVTQGQTVGQVDGALAQDSLQEQSAELAARQYTVEESKRSLAEAQAEILRLQAEIDQAQRDADRFKQLATDGAISQQQAEQSKKTVDALQQSLQGAKELVRNREQSIRAAQERVKAQEAIVSRMQEQLSYAVLTAPMTGLIMDRLVDTGDFVQVGQALVQIGDFGNAVVNLDVSDRELAQLKVGQSAEIRIDAYPDRVFQGTLNRIAPIADPNARLIPVEILIPNPGIPLSQGLIARVNFRNSQDQRLVIPASALTLNQTANPRSAGKPAAASPAAPKSSPPAQPDQQRIFVLIQQGEKTIVEERSVQLGDRLDDQVEIRSGLAEGESYVTKTNAPLISGQTVRVSLLAAQK